MSANKYSTVPPTGAEQVHGHRAEVCSGDYVCGRVDV